MQRATGTVERAWQIAGTGLCANIEQIARQLRDEGFSAVSEHLGGPMLRRQLAVRMKASR